MTGRDVAGGAEDLPWRRRDAQRPAAGQPAALGEGARSQETEVHCADQMSAQSKEMLNGSVQWTQEGIDFRDRWETRESSVHCANHRLKLTVP